MNRTHPVFHLIIYSILFIITYALTGCAKKSAEEITVTPIALLPDDGSAHLLQLINKTRIKKRRSTLTVDPRLVSAAREHSESMARHQYFAHTGKYGTHFQQRMLKYSYPLSHSAENLAIAPNAEIAYQMWYQSKGHRKNMLHKRFRRVGIFRTANYWTAVFAAPDGT